MRFEVFTVLPQRIQIFWGVMLLSEWFLTFWRQCDSAEQQEPLCQQQCCHLNVVCIATGHCTLCLYLTGVIQFYLPPVPITLPRLALVVWVCQIKWLNVETNEGSCCVWNTGNRQHQKILEYFVVVVAFSRIVRPTAISVNRLISQSALNYLINQNVGQGFLHHSWCKKWGVVVCSGTRSGSNGQTVW